MSKSSSSNARFTLVGCLISAASVALTGIVYLSSMHHYQEAQEYYHIQSHNDTWRVKERLETLFQETYLNLRTFGRMPAVRNYGSVPGSVSPSDSDLLQELFNNLESRVEVLRLYILTKDFDPNNVNVSNGIPKQFGVMFDKVVLDNSPSKGGTLPDSGINSSYAAEKLGDEINIITDQRSRLMEKYPDLKQISGLNVPALSNQEENVVDKNGAQTDTLDSDDSGTVYTIPFYGMDGQFRGTISAVIGNRVLRNTLPEGRYALFSTNYRRHILQKNPSDFLSASRQWIENSQPDPELIYSESVQLSVEDDSGKWVLWAGFPNSDFEGGKGHNILRNSYITCGMIVLFNISALLNLYLFNRKTKRDANKLIIAQKETEIISRGKGNFAASIIENAVDGMVTIDEHGIIQIFNPAAERIFGYSSDEAIGKNVSILMPQPYQGEHDGYMQNYQQSGKAKVIGIGREVKGLRKDGTVFAMYLALSEIRINGKRSYCGTIRDISGQKKIQAQIIEATEKLRLIFEHIGEGVYGINTKGQTIFSNKAAETLLGHKLKDMQGRLHHDLLHHHNADGTALPQEQCTICKTLVDGNTYSNAQGIFWRKDGASVAVNYSAAPMRDAQDNITGIVVIFRNSTGDKS